ncbi:MAG: hypothetical protein IJM92_10305 [Fibrobacter sp.]|uniref:hypothetical protein n=1 Tax=Fibrobacter sp. TaxID=35828 RepID=UPI0025C7147E|nr:hypothetical protein [Fibrobacter sp.]MBQ7080027.1 hypothetical protein [Fibrobacter sp.]
MIPTTEKSSSSEGPNSSSETELCKSLPVDEIPYNAKSACFKNNGHCYKCKAGISESDCLSSWAWQNPYTPVNTYHWFNEVDCSTGEKTDKGIGVCPAQPLDAIPSDLSNACFAMDGKCYKCKDSSPYGGCAQSWIWTQKLYYAEPYYLEEVDCYDPFEDEEKMLVEGCVDESVLRKVSARESYHDSDNAVNDYSVVLTKSVKKYDALGRHGTNKQPSHMALYQKNMGIPQQKIESSVILQLPSISSADYCDRDSLGSWNCNKNKKGLKKRVWSVDEFVNPTKCNIKKGRDYWYFIKNTDPKTGKVVSKTYVGGVTCAWPNVTINHDPKSQKNELIYSNEEIVGAKATVKYRFYTHTTLGENNHIIMKAGDVFFR